MVNKYKFLTGNDTIKDKDKYIFRILRNNCITLHGKHSHSNSMDVTKSDWLLPKSVATLFCTCAFYELIFTFLFDTLSRTRIKCFLCCLGAHVLHIKNAEVNFAL